jgi:hypothetical protein
LRGEDRAGKSTGNDDHQLSDRCESAGICQRMRRTADRIASAAEHEFAEIDKNAQRAMPVKKRGDLTGRGGRPADQASSRLSGQSG